MITAQRVEAKLKQSSERHAVPQRKPREPSEVKEVHALTYDRMRNGAVFVSKVVATAF